MRLHRFFVEEELQKGKEFATEDRELIHQWKDVFRLRTGEGVILLDNSGSEFHGEITLLSKDRATVSVDEKTEGIDGAHLYQQAYLFAALIKKDNFEWILEKGTELGVTSFIPIVSARSEKKNLNIERAKKIIKEASEQSGRMTLPILEEVTDLKKVLENKEIKFVVFHLEGDEFRKENFKIDEKIGILIGPEGGWTDEEINLFKENKIPIVKLGAQTLRAETAAIVSAAMLLL